MASIAKLHLLTDHAGAPVHPHVPARHRDASCQMSHFLQHCWLYFTVPSLTHDHHTLSLACCRSRIPQSLHSKKKKKKCDVTFLADCSDMSEYPSAPYHSAPTLSTSQPPPTAAQRFRPGITVDCAHHVRSTSEYMTARLLPAMPNIPKNGPFHVQYLPATDSNC